MPPADPGVIERQCDGCLISTDPAKLDLDVIHGFLSRAYWCEGLPRDVLERAIRNSLCFGVYVNGRQVGFARVITDHATYAYLADVFILEEHRAQGLSKQMMDVIMLHPDLQGLRRWTLLTRDAHGLYRRFGFVPPTMPERYMELTDPDVYRRSLPSPAGNRAEAK